MKATLRFPSGPLAGDARTAPAADRSPSNRHLRLSFFPRLLVPAIALVLLAAHSQCADGADERRFPAVFLFVNNHRYGTTNGASSELQPEGRMTCGHPGHVSEVAWAFLRTGADGDIYKVTRIYPSDSITPGTETKEVAYAGKALVLWHDDYQKITMSPKSPLAPSPAQK